MSAVIRYIGKHIERLNKPTITSNASLPHFTPAQVRELSSIFSFLNDKDRDILCLIFVSGKKQKSVQKILQRGQSSLSYDIKRIRRRLKFIFYIYSVFDIFLEFLRKENKTVEIDPDDVDPSSFKSDELEILTLMFYTSSFTLTSRVLGISQVAVRHTYTKCLRKLEEREMWHIYEIFIVIRFNLNTMKRIYGLSIENRGERRE